VRRLRSLKDCSATDDDDDDGDDDILIKKNMCIHILQRSPTGGPQVTSGPKPHITTPVKLFVNLLQAIANLFILFVHKELKINVLLVSSALRASTTHAIQTLTIYSKI
jgi:hypothetical protein